MTAAHPLSFLSLDADPSQRVTASGVPKSHGSVSDQSFGAVIPLDMIDGAEFRAWFMITFAEWLQSSFRNPEAVAVTFNVRFSTACNWWNADNRASGDIVARAFMTCPQATAWFLQEWAAR